MGQIYSFLVIDSEENSYSVKNSKFEFTFLNEDILVITMQFREQHKRESRSQFTHTRIKNYKMRSW